MSNQYTRLGPGIYRISTIQDPVSDVTLNIYTQSSGIDTSYYLTFVGTNTTIPSKNKVYTSSGLSFNPNKNIISYATSSLTFNNSLTNQSIVGFGTSDVTFSNSVVINKNLVVLGNFQLPPNIAVSNISAGSTGDILYQYAPGITSFISPGLVDYVLTSNGPGLPPSFKVSTGGGGSYVPNAGIASYANVAGLATVATYANTSGISSYSVVSGVSTYSATSGIASYANISGVSTYSTTSGLSTTSNFSVISGYSTISGVSTYSLVSGISSYSNNSGFSSIAIYSNNSGISSYSLIAGLSTVSNYSQLSGLSTYSNSAGISSYAVISGYSTFSGISSYSNNSGISSFANISGISTYSIISGYSTSSGISTVSTYSNLSGISTISNFSVISGYSTLSGISSFSVVSGFSTSSNYALIAGISTYSTSSGISTYANTSGVSTYAVVSDYSTSSGISSYSPLSGVSTSSNYALVAGVSTYSTVSGYSTTAGISSSLAFGSGSVGVTSLLNTLNTNLQSVVSIGGTTGQVLSAVDPGGQRLWYWNPSTLRLEFLSLGANLSISSGIITVTGTGITPGGLSGEIQYNLNGSFAGITSTTVDTSGNIGYARTFTHSGRYLNTRDSAASSPSLLVTGTVFSGGTGSTTQPHIYYSAPGATAPSTFTTSGMVFGINMQSGFAGDYLWLNSGSTTANRIRFSPQTDGYGPAIFLDDMQIRKYFGETRITGSQLAVNSPELYVGINNNCVLAFQAGATYGIANYDLVLQREASGVLAQRRTTNPQTFRLYNTFSSSTNFERARIQWSSNIFLVGTEKGSGGGVGRTMELQTDGTTRLTLDTVGSVRLTTGLTVAGLPSTPDVGMIARVTDATSPTLGATVAGGGSAFAIVCYNGANWTVMGI